MPRSRIEGLLTSFPKLMPAGQQHTTIDTETIRYVYQPMDTLYMVLITNRQSNIVQDIDTLHLFARAATDVCGGGSLHEFAVLEHCFELLCVFDEIVNLGLRENVNLAQLKTIMEMESQEEKIQEAISKNKEKEAKEELKRRAKQFEQQRKEASRRGTGSGSGSGSFKSSLGSFTNSVKNAYSPVEPTISTFDNDAVQASLKPSSSKPALQGRGMKLGGKKDRSASTLFGQDTELAQELDTKLNLEAETSQPDVYREDVHIEVEERISAVVNRDGGVEALEVKGELTLVVADEDKGQLQLRIDLGDESNMQIKTHPHIDKKRFQGEHVLALKDASRSFPVNQPVGLFKWRFVSQDDASLPLSINCWPTVLGDGRTEVNIEYELESEDLELKGVTISIPLPADGPARPVIGNVDGDYTVNPRTQTLEWQFPIIDRSNKSGSLEFTLETDDIEGFFPVSVAFVAHMPFCDVNITEALRQSSGEPVVFSKAVTLVTDDYRIV
ncbi:coatomer subunit delta [Tieghemiomyces parasiticus]|uniref:Coatomer subunit delta n=1 Tax=Tieghemiomyces parasiticus TaxID=78921 RepID=A0A9W7ZT48_9FUNG|nr:coatomer subunit delta [Tieghemiomyces parasiticus]